MGKKKTDPAIEKLSQDLEKAREAQTRALADLENFRRREGENKKNWVKFGIAEFLKQLTPQFLQLKLAAEHTKDTDAQKTLESFLKKLNDQGVTMINPKPETPVDPDLHEVLMTAEGKSGCVVKTLEIGWKYQDIVLVPAKVSAASTS